MFLVKHTVLLIIAAITAIFGFFYIFLPSYTNHGETITVPDVVGIPIDEIDEFLTKRNLRFSITRDSSYSSKHLPGTVLKQFPVASTQVKENRKIYLTLNAKNPPTIEMPDLVGGSLKSAQLMIKSRDLKLGKITYVPDDFPLTVLAQRFQGREIEKGSKVQKGTIIDLDVGDGKGQTTFHTPILLGYDEDEAKFTIVGSGLKVGKVNYYKPSEVTIDSVLIDLGYENQKDLMAGMVFRQHPIGEEPTQIGNRVDLWIVEKKELNLD